MPIFVLQIVAISYLGKYLPSLNNSNSVLAQMIQRRNTYGMFWFIFKCISAALHDPSVDLSFYYLSYLIKRYLQFF
jgi:hypothetical protein